MACVAAPVFLVAADSCSVEGRVVLPASLGGGVGQQRLNPRYQAVAANEVGPAPRPRAVISIEGVAAPEATNAPARDAVVRYEQQKFQFVPAVLAIRVGTQVEFPNRDSSYHNVLSFSPTKEFDLGRYLKDEKPPVVTFDKAGVVELNCEIHEHMRGYIVVLDTPFFTLSDEHGNYKIGKVPAGKFTVRVWAGPKNQWKKAVEVAPGETLRLDFPDASRSAN